MPATFLTTLERSRFDQIPNLEESDLQQGFFLTQTDIEFINAFHGSMNRLAVSMQLCLVRYYGFLEENWRGLLTQGMFEFIAPQLGLIVDITSLSEYGKRKMSRLFHLQQILRYLDYRRWQPIMDEPVIEKWLIERGMEHDNEVLRQFW